MERQSLSIQVEFTTLSDLYSFFEVRDNPQLQVRPADIPALQIEGGSVTISLESIDGGIGFNEEAIATLVISFVKSVASSIVARAIYEALKIHTRRWRVRGTQLPSDVTALEKVIDGKDLDSEWEKPTRP